MCSTENSWENTEDEILKAAVMKYGLHKWEKIAALLPRKSFAQCEARWRNWIDPSLKKTEWTKAENEKLLHLAKILPNQWNTIAPILQRNSSQCHEQHEKLLTMYSDSTVLPEVAPDSRMPIADPKDKDREQLEMLEEARTRLANTMGKKALRCHRRRKEEEAMRVIALKKKREERAHQACNIKKKTKIAQKK